MLGYDKVGRLEEGWAADAAIFDMSGMQYAGSLSDPVAALLFCGYDHQTKYTIVNGQIAVDDGHLVGTDEDQLAHDANATAARLWKKGGLK